MSETYMLDDPRTVLEWYDFLCPFCYVGQYRTAISSGMVLASPRCRFRRTLGIPPGGVPLGPRNGPMYEMLEREANEAGLPLNCPSRLPNTRLALAAAESARRQHRARSRPIN